jgi:hypothetical protein
MNQEEHAKKFAQCTKNLRLLAENLARIDPSFTHGDVALTHLAVALDMLIAVDGNDATVAKLRQVADLIEKGGWQPHTFN